MAIRGVLGKGLQVPFHLVLIGLLGFSAEVLAVTLAWNPNPEPDIAGYRLFYGETNSAPTPIDVGNRTNQPVSNLTSGKTYYFYLTAYNTSGLESQPSAQVFYTVADPGPGPEPGPIGDVAFVRNDPVTRGSWKDAYGADGYVVIGENQRMPSYGNVTPTGQSEWYWAFNTTDPAAVERAGASTRLAACWYAANSFDLNLTVQGTQARRVSLYFLDWDVGEREQRIDVLDPANGAVLDTRTISNFEDGIYLTWDIRKPVKFRVTRLAGANAVVSGIFFDSAGVPATPIITPPGGVFNTSVSVSISSSPGATIYYTVNGSDPTTSSTRYTGPFNVTSTTTVKARAFNQNLAASAIASAAFTPSSGLPPSGSVNFVRSDLTRGGTWKGIYGADGHLIATEPANLPSYASAQPSGATWIWDASTADTAALQRATQSDRVASVWYSPESFDVTLNLSGTTPRKVSFYCVDYDFGGRSQRIQFRDANSGELLDSTGLMDFENGVWLEYEISGRVIVRFIQAEGYNAVLSGIFFDPAQ